MRGDIFFDFFGSRAFIYIEDITNFDDRTTDRLRLRLWASKEPWSFDHPGRVLATTRLPRLGAGRDLDDVHKNTRLHHPSSTGWYHVALTLEERVVAEDGSRQWEVRDAVEFDGRVYFVDDDWDPFWPFD